MQSPTSLSVAREIATRNPNTHSILYYYPRVTINRKSNDGTLRQATYDCSKEGKPLIETRRMYLDKYTYNYEKASLEPCYKQISYDTKGNYYNGSSSKKQKPFKSFTSFSEMLDYFRNEKVKKNKPKNTVGNFVKNLFTPNLENATVDFSEKSLQGNALTRRVKKENVLIKPVKDRINAKLAVGTGLIAAGALSTIHLLPFAAATFCALGSYLVAGNVFDKFALKGKSFFKNYKNMISSQEYRNIMQRAKRIYH